MATLYRMGRQSQSQAWPTASDGERGGIGELLVAEVIPRLLVAHSSDTPRPGWHVSSIGPEEAARLAPLAITCEAHVLLELIEEVMRRGVSVDRILVELLAPAARHLGIDWSADRIDFVQVSMGLWRLQEVMRELTSRLTYPQPRDVNRTALFVPMPGDNHDFGAAMVHECFAMSGWEADLLVAPTKADILDHVASTNLDLVGLTVTNDSHIEPLPALIRAIKTVSKNPDMRVMIGGRVPTQDPSLVMRVGADGTARTATTAVVIAEKLVDAARANVEV